MGEDNPTVSVTVDPFLTAVIDSTFLERAAGAAVGEACQDSVTIPSRLIQGQPLSVSIRLTNDEKIQALNHTYRGVDRPTDVLSFSFVADQTGPEIQLPSGWPLEIGEVVMSLPYAERQAANLGHSLDTELAWLVIHGTLQLLGYLHDTDAHAEHMEGIERRVLALLGITVE